MGKAKTKTSSKSIKTMADIVTERKKSGDTLKRRTSVRSSLRYISTKFRSNHHEDPTPMRPASFRPLEYKRTLSDEGKRLVALLPHYYIRDSDATKQAPEVDTKAKSAKKKVKTTTPPAVIAKKAARLLQIPLKEKREDYDHFDGFEACFLNNGFESENQLVFNFDNADAGFHRSTSSRFSVATSRRKIRHISLPEWLELPALAGESDMEVADVVQNIPSIAANHKPSKKEAKLMQQRLDKLARVTNHLPALFDAVQHGYLEKARTILESTDVDVNSLNTDGLSPLDIAVLSNNRQLVKMLVSFGAKEGNHFTSTDKFGLHLKQLLGEAEMRLQELGGYLDEPCGALPNNRASFSSIISNAYPASSVTGCAGSDNEKQALVWERRAKALRRLVLGFAQARPPDPPSLVALDLTSATTVAVRLQEASSIDSPITTKFRVQWSTRADFSVITGEKDVIETTNPYCRVDLTQGRRYFFRAACGNLKGFGVFVTATPTSVVPSTWREIQQKDQRFHGKLKKLDQLMGEVRQFRPGSEMLEIQGPQRRAQRKKTTIKQLFTAASKFQKHLRRGIHLACVLYHEDKVLVTNEDFLPVIEIDDAFPSSIYPDLYWFMKVACTWDDTKSLRSDMEKSTSSGIHFRTKLLSAVLQMQSSLCLQDLGQVYYKPLKDAQGTVVISTINYVKAPKSVSVLNSRWLPMNKVFKKLVLSDDHNISEVLMASIQEQINYHQVSSLRLSRGLYLAYLKMQSSMDVIQVVVSTKSPNMLPHCKIRDNPHVSAEEWEYLRQQHLPDILDNATELQRTFLELVTSAAKRLFNYMDISNDDAGNHRLYEAEVVDLTDDVSFIVICPPAELSCSVPGQREMLLQRADLLSLPLQVFEMIHLNTYQNNIVKKYAKLSCLLELDAATASHLHREAFSNSEVAIAKERLTKLQELQSKLNNIWKSIRWLMDVITFARDRVTCGVSMRYILEKEIGTCCSPKRSLLQLPPRDAKVTKSTPGRGSWPGPGGTNGMSPGSNLINEFSKSEQHLSTNETTQYLSACSDLETRKLSESFNGDYISNDLPPSRSEDMIFNIPLGACQQKYRSNNSISSTSPLLGNRQLHSGSMASVTTLNTTNTSDSMHSLSSEGDGILQPVDTSTPNKSSKPRMAPSKSLTNVKENVPVKVRSRYLHVGYPMGPSRLESSMSKSLTNIRSMIDVEPTSKPPLEIVKRSTKKEDGPKSHPFELEPQSSSKDLQSGILQVFAAYETGLANGTSLKLHVTPRTTAREVVDLVVKQLNMAVLLKGKDGPIYSIEKLKNFCLVAVIGARERCLRDDFKPLQLQNPWKKGRLFVRQKQEVLAALEHSSRHSTII